MGLQDMSLPRFPLLSEEETLRLLEKTRQGDQKAREKLVNCNYRLVFNILKRFEGRGYDEEDIFQIGVIGLIKAIDNFDPSFNVKFSTYAVPMIIGEIRRFLRDDHPIKTTRALKERAVQVSQSRERLVRKLAREPTVEEIARELGMEKEEVVLAIEAAQFPVSLFESVGQEGEDSSQVIDYLPGTSCLPERERQIILLRYFQDKTQAEVGSQLGLSQVQVSRLEKRAFSKLRAYLS
jgi:RNA polymerase sporulation-specific sigma factor